jgi:predicted O-methyltransferase YrrM
MGFSKESEVHPHSKEERSELFLAYGAASTEIEVLNWLHATVCILKPENILETGTAGGIGTIALGQACKDNGFGMVHSLEISEKAAEKAQRRVNLAGVSKHVTIYVKSSLDFLSETDLKFEFGFFDSLTELRPQEFAICQERGLWRYGRGSGPVAVFHDTAARRAETHEDPTPEVQAQYRKDLDRLCKEANAGWFESELSRGFIAFFLPQTRD